MLLRLVDRVEYAAVADEFLANVIPVLADVGHREEPNRRKCCPVLLEDLLVARTVVVLGDDLLRLVRIEEFQIGFGRGPRAFAVDIRIYNGNVRFGARGVEGRVETAIDTLDLRPRACATLEES